MRTLILAVQLVVATLVAVVRGITHRIAHGPTVPSWSWSTEMKVVATRGFIMAARAHPEPDARRRLEARVNPPLPRHLRRRLAVENTTLGGVPTEHHRRLDAATDRTLLYFHGGGYVSGNPGTHRRFVARLADAIDAEAWVPNYRIAPDHRFPAALDDAVAAYRALLADVDPSRLIVGGDSAGGGLAAALLLRLRDEGTPLPAGAMLFSPYTDLEHTAPSIFRNVASDYLPVGEVRPNWEYLGDHDPRDPYASPMYGDFSGLPPLLVFAGGREMILDDALRLTDAAQRDEVEVDLHIAYDMFHVWPAFLPNHPDTHNALAACRDFTARVAG